MIDEPPDTAGAISPDSGQPWAASGVWEVCDGVHRIPLPLPNDGLRAINVYVLESDDGLTLIDGGWSIEQARQALARGLKGIGYTISDIRRFLVTHAHRDHYAMASVLSREIGACSVLGRGEEPAITAVRGGPELLHAHFRACLSLAGALELAPAVTYHQVDPDEWRYPDAWIDGPSKIGVGPRTLEAIPTPGHTPGHYVFADQCARVLFAGDHVLPTITPSIGFTLPRAPDPLGTFLASLARVRSLPDMRILPAHGPIATSTHRRVEELLAFHEERLSLSLAALGNLGRTGAQVAELLPWTRRKRPYAGLDTFNRQLAALETMAHLDVLVARGQATRSLDGGTAVYRMSNSAGSEEVPPQGRLTTNPAERTAARQSK